MRNPHSPTVLKTQPTAAPEPQQTVDPPASLLARLLRLVYTFVAYVTANAALVYFILFISDSLIPITVNSGPYNQPVSLAILINFSLLFLFALQHSVMARGTFKNWLKSYFHSSIERATYCFMTGLVLGLICFCWAPIAGQVWHLESGVAIAVVRIIGAFGWLIVIIATFQLDYFELLGLRQVYCHFIGKPMPAMRFKQPGLYKWVRHPIQTGILIGMWFVPSATFSHLFLAGGLTAYIFIGLYFEEKDLINEFGHTYREYQRRVGKIFPFR